MRAQASHQQQPMCNEFFSKARLIIPSQVLPVQPSLDPLFHPLSLNKHPEAKPGITHLASYEAGSESFTYTLTFTPPASPERGTLTITPISWVWRLRLKELENMPRVYIPSSPPCTKLFLHHERGNNPPLSASRSQPQSISACFRPAVTSLVHGLAL